MRYFPTAVSLCKKKNECSERSGPLLLMREECEICEHSRSFRFGARTGEESFKSVIKSMFSPASKNTLCIRLDSVKDQNTKCGNFSHVFPSGRWNFEECPRKRFYHVIINPLLAGLMPCTSLALHSSRGPMTDIWTPASDT